MRRQTETEIFIYIERQIETQQGKEWKRGRQRYGRRLLDS